MAVAKELPETYFFDSEEAREAVIPYKGQKCIVIPTGDIYVCITEGIWHKVKVGE